MCISVTSESAVEWKKRGKLILRKNSCFKYVCSQDEVDVGNIL